MKLFKGFKGIGDNFDYAIAGIIHGLKTQRNMQLHITVTVLVLLASLFLDLTRIELALIFFAIGLVLISEMLNTAIESMVDLITETHHRIAGTAKDIGAGAVLIASIGAVVIGYLVLYERIHLTRPITFKIENSPIHLTLVSLSLVIIFTLAIKSIIGRSTFVSGGMPSGHSAIAFSIWTSITFITQSTFISLLVLVIAILVCYSRLYSKVHTIKEVVCGIFLGSLITSVIFLSNILLRLR